MANLVKIIEKIIEDTEISLLCDYEYLPLLNLYRCTPKCESTFWVFECMDILFFGVPSIVVKLEDAYFDVQLSVPIEIDTTGTIAFNLKSPKFIHGTVPMANVEIKDDLCVPPLCYMWEIFTSQYQSNDSIIDYIGQRVRLFFLNNYSSDDHLTDDHYKRCILPMEKLALHFVQILKNHKSIDYFYAQSERFDIIPRVKVGNYTGANGNDKGLFNKNLSGVELVINIAVKKDTSCKC